jgi:Tol biopolymer transport system component
MTTQRPLARRGLHAALVALTFAALLATATTGSAAPAPSEVCDEIAWSGVHPDGSGGFDAGVHLSAPDGTEQRAIATTGFSSEPRFAPDGSKIAWIADDGTTDQVYIANRDGSGRVSLSDDADPTNDPDPRANGNLMYSPDGSKVLWTGSIGGNDRIFTANVDGTGRVDITSSAPVAPTALANPVWSPDGSRIAFRGRFGGPNQIGVAHADGSSVTALPISSPGFSSTSSLRPNGAQTECSSPSSPTSAVSRPLRR